MCGHARVGLQYFKHVILMGSLQDKYAPFHSARIELHKAALLDKKRGASMSLASSYIRLWIGPVYHAMVNNLLSPLGQVHLKRIDIGFVVSEQMKCFAFFTKTPQHKKRTLDTLIGRSAHIYFLDQDLYMDMFAHVYKPFLE